MLIQTNHSTIFQTNHFMLITILPHELRELTPLATTGPRSPAIADQQLMHGDKL